MEEMSSIINEIDNRMFNAPGKLIGEYARGWDDAMVAVRQVIVDKINRRNDERGNN